MTHTRFNLNIAYTALAIIASSFLGACTSSTGDSVSDSEKQAADAAKDSGDGDAESATTDGDVKDGDVVGQGGASGDDDTKEVEAPSIPTATSTSPSNEDVGVFPEAELSVTFSEPMDSESVEAAYSSETLPSEEVSFEWNDDFTVLTIVPMDFLDFATSPEVLAVAYDFSVSTDALSEAGEALSEEVSVSFHTARRLEQTLSSIGKLSGTVLSNLTTVPFVAAGDTTLPTEIGMAYAVGACTFDLDELPTDVLAFEDVRLKGDHDIGSGDPYGELGDFEFYDASFLEFTWEDIVMGDLVTPITTRKKPEVASFSVTVIDEIAAHYDNETFAQFAFKFEGTTNGDGTADSVTLTDPTLHVQYWVP